jgi:3-hydroxymyristoyl/3-hydroxydecanoyl-(acyl carrier protein) dehydratase
VNVAIAIPADGPLFEGHFPGRPILPGIAELVLVAAALAEEGVGAGAGVSAIPFVRFRGLVLPGDALEVNAVPRGEGGVRFEVRRAGEVVANGAMTFGAPQGDDGGRTAVASRASRGAPPLQELIPHRPPMLFVERIVGEAEDGATCLGRVPGACALVASGSTPAFVALEAAAQTAAVWEALRRSREAGVHTTRTGYLVSLSDVVLHQRTIPADADLIASIRLVATAPPLATYAVDVAVEGGLALRGTIGTYLSD